jgi:HEPN domain-containing protein
LETIAKSNLSKAIQFLEGAELSFEAGNYDSVVVLATMAGIKSKDSIAIWFTGKSRKGKSHVEAVAELKEISQVPSEVIRAFRELVARKSEAQYGTELISRVRAEAFLRQARSLVLYTQNLLGNI